MEQIQRIQTMEALLDECTAAAAALEEALDRYDGLKESFCRLYDYYFDGSWLEDHDADCAGQLPEGLKRGVLSQDAVYDLFARTGELEKQLARRGTKQED